MSLVGGEVLEKQMKEIDGEYVSEMNKVLWVH